MDSFINWLKGKELNEMSPVMMMGNAPFESLAGMSKSRDAMKSDFDKLLDIKDGYIVFKHKRLEYIIIAKEYDDLVLKEERWAIIAEMSFKTEKLKSTNKLINGKEVDPAKTYYIATSDYLALGGDNMAFFGKGEMISTGIKLRDLFLEKFKANPEIVAPKDVRLLFKNKKKQN